MALSGTQLLKSKSYTAGVVDAAVSGGIKNYMEAFLTKKYIMENCSQDSLLRHLIVSLNWYCSYIFRQAFGIKKKFLLLG